MKDTPIGDARERGPSAGCTLCDPVSIRTPLAFVFQLTGLSRIVLQQAIVPESSRNQASCLSVEKKHYIKLHIELRYKLC